MEANVREGSRFTGRGGGGRLEAGRTYVSRTAILDCLSVYTDVERAYVELNGSFDCAYCSLYSFVSLCTSMCVE